MRNVWFAYGMSCVLITAMAYAKDCSTLDVTRFETWQVIHDFSKPIQVSNYAASISSFETGVVFRDKMGRTFFVPGVEALLRSTSQSELAQAFQIALKNLRSQEGGVDWLKRRMSDDIRHWAIKKDNPSYRGDDIIEQPFGGRESAYQLPDGSRIYLSEATRAELVQKWGIRFRPGDF